MTYIEWLASIDAELEKRDLPSREALGYTDAQWREMYKADPDQWNTVDGILREIRDWHSLNSHAPLRWD
jgi:hypothetical protein